ncbi:hypothetical protein CK203_053658 [Vitis vinifera]|uniref:Uncharacterized protein n=1 Tax=Vitis vinifera TaxID=29760 RepID=A0A438GS40_VITVI|nr:hypothetical protein CK203_053658 [Vitis vinifera]
MATSHHLQNEKTRGSDSKSLPTIILHNHFPRSLTAASPTMQRGPPDTRGDNIGAVCGKLLLFILIQSLAKMATPSQSRSSGREEEDNHEWRQAIEKRQLASEKQLRALLQETERLREENAVLRIQASTSGPPRRQRSKGQVANSRPEPESIYPGSTGAVPGTYNARPHEPRTPMPRAPREGKLRFHSFLSKKTA